MDEPEIGTLVWTGGGEAAIQFWMRSSLGWLGMGTDEIFSWEEVATVGHKPVRLFIPTAIEFRDQVEGELWVGDKTYHLDLRPKITDYQQLHDLPEHQVVQDADGQVWCVVRPRCCANETWLAPFSDEYAFSVLREPDPRVMDGLTSSNKPALPITDLGVTSKGGG
jgi:hypothetical protein